MMNVGDRLPNFDRARKPLDSFEMAPRRRAFIAGLDLGQARDPSALSLLELDVLHPRIPDDPHPPKTLDLVTLQRWELGTMYHAVVRDVERLFAQSLLSGGACALVVDATGVGPPVVEIFQRAGLHPIPLVITGGTASSNDNGWWHVPKRDLVSSLAVAFENDRLRIAEGLRHGPVLRKEIGNFRAKISLAGNDTYEAWREGDHDDLVLATAMAVWMSSRLGGRLDESYVIAGNDWTRNV